MPPKQIIGVLGALGLALAGCGSSGGAATPHFAARADAICARADAQIEALRRSGASLPAIATTTAAEVPIVQAEVTQLAALTAPHAERTQFAQTLSTGREEISLIGKLIAAIHAGDRARIAALAVQGNAIELRATATATALGLSDCTQQAEPGGD
jgi:hypothetical protein